MLVIVEPLCQQSMAKSYLSCRGITDQMRRQRSKESRKTVEKSTKLKLIKLYLHKTQQTPNSLAVSSF